MDTSIESFINYCDSMMIVTEGVKEGFEKVKAWLIEKFNKILDWLNGCVSKMKPTNKLKPKLLKMISRAKSGLVKSKSLNAQNKELADRLVNEVESLNEEIKVLNNNLKKDRQKSANEIIAERKHKESSERLRNSEKLLRQTNRDLQNTKSSVANSISNRHKEASKIMRDALNNIFSDDFDKELADDDIIDIN